MSSSEPGAQGGVLLHFRMGERVANSVWRAEDTRTGKTVAIKVLSKGLPKDGAKREALIREVRNGAAIYHSSIVPILEISVAGETLVMVMEWLEGQSIAARVKSGGPMPRSEFFRVMYQVVDAVKLLHAKNVVHGNIAGDAIILLPSGQAKLAGLNLNNIFPRQGQPSQFQQKGSDIRAVSYMAPEQITNQPVTAQTDIYSLGTVMYEAACGRLPYIGNNAGEVAHKIVDEQPPSPKSLNPAVDNAVLSVMGVCLFKDTFKRIKDTKALLDAIVRVEPDASKFAIDIAKSAAAPAAAGLKAPGKSAILFVADVANYDQLNKTDPSAAAKAASRMQQILGEAVYLFDGQVLDPFGPCMIAEMPSIESAIEAGRKGEFDFSTDQQSGEVIHVRLLLHAGEVQAKEGSAGGAGVTKGLEVLKTMPPHVLHLSEDFVKRGKPSVRLRDSGARAGVKLFTILPAEKPVESGTELGTAAEEAEVAEEEMAVAEARAVAAKKKRQRMIIAVAAVAVLAVAGTGALLMRPKSEAPKATAAVKSSTSSELPPATAATPRKVLLDVNGADPTIMDRANALRTVATEILKTFPEIRLADVAAPDVSSFSAQIRTGAAGPEIVVGSGAPAPAPDLASAIQPLLLDITSRLHVPDHGAANPVAYNAFADAVAASAANDIVKTDAALRAATKADPNFLAAQLMAMKFFTAQGKQAESVDAAKHVLALLPDNTEAARMVARAGLASGELASAFFGYAVIVKHNPNDTEALNRVGRYAVSASDMVKLDAVLKRLGSSPAVAEVHAPDVLLAAGKIDAAVEKYYVIEEHVPNNPSLSLKIGRIAVLRHSTPMAELELKKLQETDPLYGVHILKAYLAASSGNKADAAAELKAAQAGSTPGDDYYTSVAEIAAINGDVAGILDALERAAQRKEPTASYVLNDPLFSFLNEDPRFQKIRESFTAQQAETRSALAAVPL